MSKKALLALMMAMVMLLTAGCSLIVKDEAVDRATEIVKVFDDVYTKGEIQDNVASTLDYYAWMYSLYGQAIDPTDPDLIASVQESVCNGLVEESVKNHKAAELGLNQLTAEEQAAVAETAQTEWENTLNNIKDSYFAETELEGDALNAAVEAKAAELGYSYEAGLTNSTTAAVMDKLEAAVKAEVTEVSDDDLQAYVDERAESAKSSYETYPANYGTAVNNGNTVYYRPAGYRMVKNLLVKFTDADQAVLDALDEKLNAAKTEVTTLTSALTEAGVEDVDALVAQVTVSLQPVELAAEEAAEVEEAAEETATATDLTEAVEEAAEAVSAITVVTEATVADVTADFAEEISEETAANAKALATAKAEVEFYTAQKEAAVAQALAALDEKADALTTELAAGADFNTVMAANTDDPGMQEGAATAATGYAVCEATTNFDPAFVAAAMALEKVGDISPKTAGMYGYYILQYAADVQEGPVALDEVRDAVYDTVLSNKQTEHFNECVAQWVKEANATIDLDALRK